MPKLKNQEREALATLQVLLQYQTSQEYLFDVSELFYCYLESSSANDAEQRVHLMQIFIKITDFFKTLECLPKIDRYRNRG